MKITGTKVIRAISVIAVAGMIFISLVDLSRGVPFPQAVTNHAAGWLGAIISAYAAFFVIGDQKKK